MDHQSILRQLKLSIQLMELHDENPFKVRSYQSALNTLERGDMDLMDLGQEEITQVPGLGKSVAEAILSIRQSGSFSALEVLLEKTPSGILEMLQIKGLGPKKVKSLWEDLGITSTHELMEACQSGKIAQLKGFGEKTQESILQNLLFRASNAGKWLFADIEVPIQDLSSKLQQLLPKASVRPVGDFVRKMEIISEAEFLIVSASLIQVKNSLKGLSNVEWELSQSGPFTWRGKLLDPELKIILHFSSPDAAVSKEMLLIASKSHLNCLIDEQESMAEKIRKNNFLSEEEFFTLNQLQFIPREMREGFGEVELAKKASIPVLLEASDFRGSLHNHSTYSDGKHSLRQMAEHCRSLGYEYLGISDHSRTASYAGGLEIERVIQQQKEIDALNQEMAPFRIFKGIESDILADGSLDYPEEVLQGFDFIVASVHSILNMDIKRATDRLITAIYNPYTTILGHPTGRLLLRREGYPVDHRAVIEACAARQVVIEINANPWRLDLDWRWIRYAMDQGVLLSINPDAHEIEGFADMYYGLCVARKGGLSKDMTLNTKSSAELEKFFTRRKASLVKA